MKTKPVKMTAVLAESLDDETYNLLRDMAYPRDPEGGYDFFVNREDLINLRDDIERHLSYTPEQQKQYGTMDPKDLKTTNSFLDIMDQERCNSVVIQHEWDFEHTNW